MAGTSICNSVAIYCGRAFKEERGKKLEINKTKMRKEKRVGQKRPRPVSSFLSSSSLFSCFSSFLALFFPCFSSSLFLNRESLISQLPSLYRLLFIFFTFLFIVSSPSFLPSQRPAAISFHHVCPSRDDLSSN